MSAREAAGRARYGSASLDLDIYATVKRGRANHMRLLDCIQGEEYIPGHDSKIHQGILCQCGGHAVGLKTLPLCGACLDKRIWWWW